jgi:hypothetical protein
MSGPAPERRPGLLDSGVSGRSEDQCGGIVDGQVTRSGLHQYGPLALLGNLHGIDRQIHHVPGPSAHWGHRGPLSRGGPR